jgi:hypothetical protein
MFFDKLINFYFSRKDKLYFEDCQDWCSTCTSSSDDSDYERWDKEDEVKHNSAAIEERLRMSRPVPASSSLSKSRHITRSTSSAVSKSRKSTGRLQNASHNSANPTIVFFDDRHNFSRPDWLLDPISYNPDSPCHSTTKKSKKKKSKKCAVQ